MNASQLQQAFYNRVASPSCFVGDPAVSPVNVAIGHIPPHRIFRRSDSGAPGPIRPGYWLGRYTTEIIKGVGRLARMYPSLTPLLNVLVLTLEQVVWLLLSHLDELQEEPYLIMDVLEGKGVSMWKEMPQRYRGVSFPPRTLRAINDQMETMVIDSPLALIPWHPLMLGFLSTTAHILEFCSTFAPMLPLEHWEPFEEGYPPLPPSLHDAWQRFGIACVRAALRHDLRVAFDSASESVKAKVFSEASEESKNDMQIALTFLNLLDSHIYKVEIGFEIWEVHIDFPDIIREINAALAFEETSLLKRWQDPEVLQVIESVLNDLSLRIEEITCHNCAKIISDYTARTPVVGSERCHNCGTVWAASNKPFGSVLAVDMEAIVLDYAEELGWSRDEDDEVGNPTLSKAAIPYFMNLRVPPPEVFKSIVDEIRHIGDGCEHLFGLYYNPKSEEWRALRVREAEYASAIQVVVGSEQIESHLLALGDEWVYAGDIHNHPGLSPPHFSEQDNRDDALKMGAFACVVNDAGEVAMRFCMGPLFVYIAPPFCDRGQVESETNAGQGDR